MEQHRREPWPHQEEIVELSRHTNVFLADDTGAGKTISCIEAAHAQWQGNAGAENNRPVQRQLPAPNLIICVKSAKLQWLGEIVKQYPGEPVYLVNRGDKEVFMKLRRKKCWIIAHFHVFHDVKLYQYVYRQVFNAVVIDEAHRIKAYNTVWAKRIRNLKGRLRIAATATQQEKSAADLYNILHFLKPHDFKGYWKFVEQYCITEENMYSDNPTILGTNKHTFPELAERMAPFYRRRMKTEIRDDMPPLIEQNVPVLMEPGQQKLYELIENSDDILVEDEAMLKDPLFLANKLSLIIRLWQTATYPQTVPGSKVSKSGKIAWVEDYISDNPTEQMIIFTWFRDTATYLANKYSDLPAYIGGHDNPLPTVDNRIVVGTIGSMGESLDLPWIDTGIFMNRSRSNIQMKQAKDRIYRINIDNAKRVMYLEAYKQDGSETIDHIIEKSLRHKWNDATFVMEAIRSIQDG